MAQTICTSTADWISGAAEHPPALLVAHVATCGVCQALLVATYATLLGEPVAPVCTCADCADDLPAFLELERRHGGAAAARRYPQLWWHLWTCPECAEEARLTNAMLDAEAAGLISAPPRVRAQSAVPVLPPIRLTRSFLHGLFGPRLAMGAVWSSDSRRMLVAEEDLPGYRLVIAVRPRDPAQYDLEIEVEPPFHGRLIVRFGDLVIQCPFADGRFARIEGLPTPLLSDQSGPDLLIALEATPLPHDD